MTKRISPVELVDFSASVSLDRILSYVASVLYLSPAEINPNVHRIYCLPEMGMIYQTQSMKRTMPSLVSISESQSELYQFTTTLAGAPPPWYFGPDRIV